MNETTGSDQHLSFNFVAVTGSCAVEQHAQQSQLQSGSLLALALEKGIAPTNSCEYRLADMEDECGGTWGAKINAHVCSFGSEAQLGLWWAEVASQPLEPTGPSRVGGYAKRYEELRELIPLPVAKLSEFTGVPRRTHYNWLQSNRATEESLDRLQELIELARRLRNAAPNISLATEFDAEIEGSLGAILLANRPDLIEDRIEWLRAAAAPRPTKRVSDSAEPHPQLEQLSPGELREALLAFARPRGEVGQDVTPPELTDSYDGDWTE